MREVNLPDTSIGSRFGRLVVISEIKIVVTEKKNGNKRKNYTRWVTVKCDCGIIKEVTVWHLKCGDAKSCGCLRKELSTVANTIHGLSYTREHNIWNEIKKRCYNPKHFAYHNYGGRGIKMCDRWLNSVENFVKDMGISPSDKHSIDRYPDKNGNYEPSNCRWATAKEQGNNRNGNVLLLHNGEEKTLTQWCEFYNKNVTSVWCRIFRHGWPIDRALTEVTIKGRNQYGIKTAANFT